MKRLLLVGVVLIEWILVTAEITNEWQYYLWAFLVVILWSEAIYTRAPKQFPKRNIRIAFFSAIMLILWAVNFSIIYVIETGLPPQGS